MSLSRFRRGAALVLITLAPGGCGRFKDPNAVTVYRDEYGIPHIYADSDLAGLYANGRTQAEDRLGEILQNFLRGMGEYSSAFGPGADDENLREDLISIMWDHYAISRARFDTLHPRAQAHIRAFVLGIRDHMAEHPDQVPAWWGDRAVDEFMPVAFSRQFIWGWPLGEALDDLHRAGVRSEFKVDMRASNEMAVAPWRSTSGAAMLVIDPHLGWFGRQRYWETRIHAGDVHISGFATAGFPYVNLGHNEHVAWAHTTGGPDTADVYELTIDPETPTRYLYEGEWLAMQKRPVELRVAGESRPRKIDIFYSHHGPVIAREGNKAWAAALAYAGEIGYLESKFHFMTARNYEDVMKALEIRQIMPQNVMVADSAGNIYYQRTGRVPVRPERFDYSRPVDGSIAATEWLGFHPTSDLISVLNPPQGYMQNCNVSPDVMMVNSTMTPDRYPDYIFNQPAGRTHQRGSRATRLLHDSPRISAEQMIEIALDRKCYQHERWLEALASSDRAMRTRRSYQYLIGLDDITRWDGFQNADSTAALKYYYWKRTMRELAGEETWRALRGRVNDYMDVFGAKLPPISLSPAEKELITRALDEGIRKLEADLGRLDATFGDVFRVGRLDAADDVSWPVGGGSLTDEDMATVRSVGFDPERGDHTRWGSRGQTSTQVVVMTDPVQSWTQPPIGQSDHPTSPHYRDQAEKLFSPAVMKPSWFNRRELRGHIVSRTKYIYPAPASVAPPAPEDPPPPPRWNDPY